MQVPWDFDTFMIFLSTYALKTFFPTYSHVLSCPEFKSTSKENQEVILDLINNGALDYSVTSDDALATYFLPIMGSSIPSQMSFGFILVHFPHVRVTNEHNKFVDINHLWVKVGIKVDGSSTGYFSLNRSDYQLSHMKANYMHSHIREIPFNNFTEFLTPCLGSGPIKTTIATLAVGYDEAIWKLFCLELDRYVGIESLSGVPYRRLEEIAKRNFVDGEDHFMMYAEPFHIFGAFKRSDLRSFVSYLIKGKKFKFNYIGGSYGLAMSYLNYRILVSNEFIEWYNQMVNSKLKEGQSFASCGDLIREGILKECIIRDGKICYFIDSEAPSRDYYRYEGKEVCKFKGESITVHIVDDTSATNSILNTTMLLHPQLSESIVKAILEIVNYKYGREERTGEAGISTPAIYI